MTDREIRDEELTKAIHSMQFVVGSLKIAANKSNGCESLICTDCRNAAIELRNKLRNYQAACDFWKPQRTLNHVKSKNAI